MLAKLLSIIILVPLAILLVVFCVANREAVTVSLDPIGTMPHFAFAAPLFVLLIGSICIGIVLGGIGAWLGQSHHRRNAWTRKHEVERLRREVEELRPPPPASPLRAPEAETGSTALTVRRAA
ncbi:lipopolysaccharide assembly protein LapA domain-containing protein [Mangrovibrevibacter kandeliae]|uniref:lipopolysaccharide assembly protein LapA domain-containing protein n=1 Tax=Mangrovibrevibacter kandeliae TaxID=2968473 RepID=UPI002119AA00|nr:LapA family protein [Aurantimonas sp. CSK15Z-1]